MHCPNCGAALEFSPFSDVAECLHCGATQTVCTLEEGHDRVGWGDEPSGTACPRCAEGLENVVLEGHQAEACPHCRGVLLTNGVFGAIIRHRRAEYRGAEFIPRPLDLDQLSDPVYCPGCQRTMEVHPYYGPGNQIIDSCCRCGLVWIDSGELTAIERAPAVRLTHSRDTFFFNGSVTTNVDPRPGSLCTVIVPRCPATIEWQMLSPSPLPLNFGAALAGFVGPVEAVEDAGEIRRRDADAGIRDRQPRPSADRRRISVARRSFRRCGVNLMALSIKFVTNCRNCGRIAVGGDGGDLRRRPIRSPRSSATASNMSHACWTSDPRGPVPSGLPARRHRWWRVPAPD